MAESRKSASKTAAASKSSTENQTENVNPTGNSGAGTGVEAPAESTARTPARVMSTEDTASGPLEPPTDVRKQAEPREGYAHSTTDNVYAEAGGRTVAGEDYSRLVDADGNELTVDAVFDDDPSKTFVTSKTRVYEEFYYPNTREAAKRLLFGEGRRIPRAQADRIKAAIEAAPEPVAAQRG